MPGRAGGANCGLWVLGNCRQLSEEVAWSELGLARKGRWKPGCIPCTVTKPCGSLPCSAGPKTQGWGHSTAEAPT